VAQLPQATHISGSICQTVFRALVFLLRAPAAVPRPIKPVAQRLFLKKWRLLMSLLFSTII
jgi:hypothetical protein